MNYSLRLAFGGVVAILGAVPAHAEYTVAAGASLRYEDNLFRNSRPFSAALGRQRSDTITSAFVQGDATFRPGDFNITVGADVAHDFYARNSSLDNFNYSATAVVTREPGATIGFSTTARIDRRLSSFADIRARLRNVQDLQQISNETTFPITPDIRLVVQPDYVRSTNSAVELEPNDFQQYGLGIGVGYFSPLGNSVSVTVSKRRTDGLNARPAFVGGSVVDAKIDLVDTAVNLKLRYAPSVLTSISADFSYVDRNDRSPIGNDYKGPAGSVTLDYHPRDSLQATLTVGRRLDAQSYVFVDSLRTDFAELTGRAAVSDRTTVVLTASYNRRRFDFDPLLATALVDRTDKTARLSAALGYRLFDRVDLGLLGAIERRRTNIVNEDYTAKTVQVSASFAFGTGRR